MKKKKKIIFICIILFIQLIYTKTYAKNIQKKFFTQNYYLYEQCKKQLKKEKFFNVINFLEVLNKKNIKNIHSDKTYIYLIYAYYKVFNFPMAQKYIVQFLKLYPKHPNIDYVLYMECLVNISIDKNIYFNNIPITHYRNDPIYAQIAFFQLKKLINYYPKSIYSVNAKKDLFCLKKRLLKYDLEILKYYFSKKQYIAVINRGENMLEKYPEMNEIITVLKYIKKSFFSLKLFSTAKKISEMILLNDI